ncbi:hypothetical protein Pint_08498 [Pistacia integerrima]|uniref:Uncharacterized protein n=1 Tax=Pistacia integerrima TaxID=434235 RepID=A0ACC0XV76_9ROSI|nr:hypothetical protein Pint_08498 [Pistacia integerrima]
MWTDILLQAVLILVSVFMFLAMYDIPQKFLTKLRFRNRADLQAKRHFVVGAQLLAQAKSSKTSRSSAASLAKQAEAEADKAISLDPKDAASHILKALVLDLQGFKTSALDSLDVALSNPAVKSLTDGEKGDALFKRAEVKVAMSRRGRVDPAIEDLNEAVRLGCDGVRVFCLLGECYEAKKMSEEAKMAYEAALKAEPSSTAVQAALARLGS